MTLEAIRSLAEGECARRFHGSRRRWRRAVTSGILDAPQLKNNPYGRGEVATRIIGGACLAVDEQAEDRLSESVNAYSSDFRENMIEVRARW